MLTVLTESYQIKRQPIVHQIGELENKRRSQESTLMTISQEVYGTPHLQNKQTLWPTIILMIALIMVGFSEWPLNSAAFETFELSQKLTYWIAFAFGMVMAILAHLSGYTLKRSVSSKQWYMGVLALTLITGSVLALYILSGLRYGYLTEMSGHDALSPILQTIVTGIIFFVGVVASFLHTSSAKNLASEKAYKVKYTEYLKNEAKITELELRLSQLDSDHANKLENESSVWEEIERVNHKRNPSPNNDVSDITSEEVLTETKNEDVVEESLPIPPGVIEKHDVTYPSEWVINRFNNLCISVDKNLNEYSSIREDMKKHSVQPTFINQEMGFALLQLQHLEKSLEKENNPGKDQIWKEANQRYSSLKKRIEDEIA